YSANITLSLHDALPILFIGILNAYNFMDGINGISGIYSFFLLTSLWYVNQQIIPFVVEDFIVYPTLACLVFLFFNFRKRAKCFRSEEHTSELQSRENLV